MVDVVDTAVTVVVFEEAARDVDSGTVDVDIVELASNAEVMVDEVLTAIGPLDVGNPTDTVEMSEAVLLEASDVVAFAAWLEVVATVGDDVIIVLEDKVVSLLVVLSAVVAGAEEDAVCGTGIALVTTSEL